MPGALIAVLLIASLLLVHFSMRQEPMPATRPLDVDAGLPLPEAGQASTVFSLTALFGAYFGIFVLLGWPALVGLGCGTAAGLLFIRNWMVAQPSRSFESFLFRFFLGHRRNAIVFGLLLIAIQCGFATSELVILREIAKATLGLRAEHATLVALSLALIGYFYVLFGGYRAVFRTDVLQFLLVAAMGVILLVGTSTGTQNATFIRWPRPGYWTLPTHSTSLTATCVYQFVIASLMGFMFLAASPDAWKRVFIVTRNKESRRRFVVFVAAGVLPFLVLLPLGRRTPAIPDGPTNAGLAFAALITNSALFVSTALGLIASFMSAFNGALLSSVQVGLVLRRLDNPEGDETPRFHWLMVAALLTVAFSFMATLSISNAYLLASVLMGPYAIVGGIQLGTWGRLSRIPEGLLLWVAVIGLVAWFEVLASGPPLGVSANTYQLNAVPFGALLCVSVGVVCWSAKLIWRGNVRAH